MRKTPTLPIRVESALEKLGSDMRTARIQRRIPTANMAERVFITRATLNKVEKGDPSVSMGTYANVLYVLGVENKLLDLIDVSNDELGLRIMKRNLPQRIRNKKYFE